MDADGARDAEGAVDAGDAGEVEAGGVPLIQDLEHYLQQNGIEHNIDNNESTLDQRELAAQIEKEETYKEHILNGFMEKDISSTLHDEKDLLEQKQKLLDSCSGQTLSIVTAHEPIHNVSLFHLVDKCDTIFTLAKSDQWSNSIKCTKGDNDDIGLTFSLAQFDLASIQEFIAIVQETKSVQDISSDCVIECCRIAHFLQASSLLQDIVDIIQESIDSANCASICILADQLEIPSLLHSSMEYVMVKLDKIKDNDIWDDFPQSLRHHVITLRNAAQSSLISRGHQSKVLFTSSNEFLGMFFDILREHKERLNEAKVRQDEIIQERKRLNAKRGRFAKEIDVHGGSVMDAAIKIEKQETRVHTLEVFYREQKAIFSRDAASEGAYKSLFSL